MQFLEATIDVLSFLRPHFCGNGAAFRADDSQTCVGCRKSDQSRLEAGCKVHSELEEGNDRAVDVEIHKNGFVAHGMIPSALMLSFAE